MRALTVRHKSRDMRLIGLIFLVSYVFTDSHWEASALLSNSFLLVGVILVSLAAILRAWSILYIAGYKQKFLVTEGPFSICRNPIYLSTVLGFSGIALDTETITYPILAFIFFLAYFLIQVRGEEARLASLHGERYLAYCRRTPRLIPNFRLLDEPREYVVRPAEFRRWLADAVWFIWGLGLVEFIDSLHDVGLLPVIFHLY